MRIRAVFSHTLGVLLLHHCPRLHHLLEMEGWCGNPTGIKKLLTTCSIKFYRMASSIKFDGKIGDNHTQKNAGCNLSKPNSGKQASKTGNTFENIFAPPDVKAPKRKIPTLFNKLVEQKKINARKPLPGILSTLLEPQSCWN